MNELPMADVSALETKLQPSFDVGILHGMLTLTFGGTNANADEPDSAVDTCSRESVADKENDV